MRRMNANFRGRTGLPKRLGALTVLVAGLVAGSVAAPAAAHEDSVDLVVLGDSYSAGLGAGTAMPSSVVPGGNCFITESGYAEALEDRRDDVEATNAACAGATAAVVPGQIQAAVAGRHLGEHTELVAITAGGNDVNFTAVIEACETGVDTCEAAVETAVDVAENQVAPALANDYKLIRRAASNATIAALGYPHLFSTKRGSESPLSPAAARVFNKGVDRLNKIIKQSAKSVPGTVYVDVTKKFKGHEIGSSDPWIYFNPLNDEDIYNFHPNAEGYEKGYANALNRVVSSSQH